MYQFYCSKQQKIQKLLAQIKVLQFKEFYRASAIKLWTKENVINKYGQFGPHNSWTLLISISSI
ncbi:hypothetical protein pb186bvf_020495 [Paramecium bursaria]